MIEIVDVLSLPRQRLGSIAPLAGQPAFRAGQLFEWLHAKRAADFGEMTNLPAALRERLAADAFIPAITQRERQQSADGTVKYLYELADGNCVETVALQYDFGLSLCISSQVGCRMGCAFCASAKGGLVRNLSAGEMLLQVYETVKDLGRRADSIVLMGIGEPLDNFDNVLDFYEIVTDQKGYGLSRRAVTLSSCGLCDRIDELAERKLPLTLSVSLHAANDQKRSALMPVNRRYNIKRLLASCRNYSEKTGRRITFEYAVINGENDSPADADALAALLGGLGAHVNLIPVNPAGGGDFSATRADAERFKDQLLARRVNATVRRTLGGDIAAACGQLRSRHTGDENAR